MTSKDFASIEADYAFFMEHATEAESDAAEYVRALTGFADGRATVRMLDFGCGTGAFTHRLVSALAWPPQSLRLTLVEPLQHQRVEAARRLAPFSSHPIETAERLPSPSAPRFDVAFSNHVLYYVDDLAATLRQLRALIAPGGKLLLAISGWDNALLRLWQVGFGLLGRPVPYHAAEDVEAVLSEQRTRFSKSETSFQIRFPDSEENRFKLLRFLFGDYLPDIPREPLWREFDQYRRGDHILMNTCSCHFEVQP